MDDIKLISNLLSGRERQAFLRYMDVERVRNERKDVDLFHDLLNETNGEEKFKTVQQRDSYHQNRKRLMNKLSEFLLVRRVQEDITGESRATALLNLSRFLLARRANETAWKFLRKALRIAEESELYDVQKRVCMFMIDHAETAPGATDLKNILRKKLAAEKKVEVEENIRIATSFIRHKLNEVKRTGKSANFNVYLEKMLDRFHITHAIFENPKYLYNIVSIVRDTYLATRDISPFESFVIETYQKVEKEYGFRRQDHHYKLHLLYMLAHALYRNRKYTEALQWMNTLHREMKKYDHVLYHVWHPKYVSLLGMLYSLTRQNQKAIEMHEEVISNKKAKLSLIQRLNMELNLAWFYVNAGKHKEANRMLVRQLISVPEMTALMGQEWMMRRHLMYSLNQYELKNEDISLQGLQEIKTRFKELLNKPVYKKVTVFLETCANYIKDPYALTRADTKQMVKRDMEMFALELEENKSLAYYAWIISKLEGTAYYDTVLEIVKWSPTKKD